MEKWKVMVIKFIAMIKSSCSRKDRLILDCPLKFAKKFSSFISLKASKKFLMMSTTVEGHINNDKWYSAMRPDWRIVRKPDNSIYLPFLSNWFQKFFLEI